MGFFRTENISFSNDILFPPNLYVTLWYVLHHIYNTIQKVFFKAQG